MEFITGSAEAILIMKRRQVSRNAGAVLSIECVHRMELASELRIFVLRRKIILPNRNVAFVLCDVRTFSTDYSLVLKTEMDYVQPFF